MSHNKQFRVARKPRSKYVIFSNGSDNSGSELTVSCNWIKTRVQCKAVVSVRGRLTNMIKTWTVIVSTVTWRSGRILFS